MNDDFRLIMISAGFEHGGNVFQRHLDGHPELFVYPFESQLGNNDFYDFLSSVERRQYRYPEFHEGLLASELYEQIVDEEMKTFLRKKEGSKFKNVDLIMDEAKRKEAFIEILGNKLQYRRRDVIEAFFKSTFIAWKNYYAREKGQAYVGYSPAIGIDSERIIKDFPSVKIIHVVRNPFSAYRDTKRRPFPQPISKYLITWNIYHSTVAMFAKLYPLNIKIVRYEDLVANKKVCMQDISDFIGIGFNETMLYPSWNGKRLEGDIKPWGTVLRSTQEYNKSIIEELSEFEKEHIIAGTTALARYFYYNEIDYLREYYAK